MQVEKVEFLSTYIHKKYISIYIYMFILKCCYLNGQIDLVHPIKI